MYLTALVLVAAGRLSLALLSLVVQGLPPICGARASHYSGPSCCRVPGLRCTWAQ